MNWRSQLKNAIQNTLTRNGYKILCDSELNAVADYIESAPNGYTIQKWFEDTKVNYPHMLIKED